jgi:hypothetical protein
MRIQYFNHQDELDPMHGTVITATAQLAKLLDDAKRQPPFIAKLKGDNGFEILTGIGEKFCCAQYSSSDGNPPYLMAMSAQPPLKRGCVDFLTADTPTPFPARYIIHFDELKAILFHFLQTGERSNLVSWEDFDPVALREGLREHLQ